MNGQSIKYKFILKIDLNKVFCLMKTSIKRCRAFGFSDSIKWINRLVTSGISVKIATFFSQVRTPLVPKATSLFGSKTGYLRLVLLQLVVKAGLSKSTIHRLFKGYLKESPILSV